MTYHEAAAEQKRLCERGVHVHSCAMGNEYILQDAKPESSDYECCPCFGCCYPNLRRTVQ